MQSIHLRTFKYIKLERSKIKDHVPLIGGSLLALLLSTTSSSRAQMSSLRLISGSRLRLRRTTIWKRSKINLQNKDHERKIKDRFNNHIITTNDRDQISIRRWSEERCKFYTTSTIATKHGRDGDGVEGGRDTKRECDGQWKGEECSKIMVITAEFIARRERQGRGIGTFDDVK